VDQAESGTNWTLSCAPPLPIRPSRFYRIGGHSRFTRLRHRLERLLNNGAQNNQEISVIRGRAARKIHKEYTVCSDIVDWWPGWALWRGTFVFFVAGIHFSWSGVMDKVSRGMDVLNSSTLPCGCRRPLVATDGRVHICPRTGDSGAVSSFGRLVVLSKITADC
jgi:hypothetical protein